MRGDPEMEAFVEEARRVGIFEAFDRAGGSSTALRRQGHEQVGPCPVHGGRRDRLQINPNDGVFLCRGSGEGGDAIGLYQHLTAADFLTACEALTGRERPGADAKRSREDRDRARREADARIAEQRAETERRAAEQKAYGEKMRQREWRRCVEDWRAAAPIDGTPAAAYLAARKLPMPDGTYVRCHPGLAFFMPPATRGGKPMAIHRGPAMLVLFVRPEGQRWQPIGLHRTWIDLENAPKFRPDLHDPDTGEVLASKKMRGSKAGGLLPLAGRFSSARRFVGGEGIETGLGFARLEGFRADTFYFAAGDLGNLAGRATRESRVRDTTRRRLDKNGRRIPVFVPGEEPDFDSPAVPIPDHAEELVLLGDGDSDPVFTRLAMKRAARRHARDGRTIDIRVAPAGTDWAEMAERDARREKASS